MDLEQKEHSMAIWMAGVDYDTFLSFDYAIYTTDPELLVSQKTTPTVTASGIPSSSAPAMPSHSPRISAGVIAGAVIAGLTVRSIISLRYFCRRGNRRRYNAPSATKPHTPRPFIIAPLAGNENSSQGHSSRSRRTIRPVINSLFKT